MPIGFRYFSKMSARLGNCNKSNYCKFQIPSHHIFRITNITKIVELIFIFIHRSNRLTAVLPTYQIKSKHKFQSSVNQNQTNEFSIFLCVRYFVDFDKFQKRL